MLNECIYKNTTPLFAFYNCNLFLETCFYIVSNDGYALDSECGDFYLCCKCNENCIFKTFINI